jgi:trimethylamine--corrinoid protein Co-methyltransferase
MVQGIKGGQLKFFSDEQIQALHNASLQVLEETGVAMQDARALETMKKAGATVDVVRQIVKIPQYLVEEALSKAPKHVKLYGRLPEWDIILFKNMVYNGSSNNAVRIVTMDGNSQGACFKDLEDFVRLQDALPSVHIMLTPLTDFVDVPKEGIYRRCYGSVLKNSAKHTINQAENSKDVKDELAMAAFAMGWSEIEAFERHPIFSMICDMAPPLRLGSHTLDVMMECAKYGVPVHVETDCTVGTTAPITAAGIAIQQNAEVLSGITLVQLINPGCPVIYAHAPFVPDLKTGAALTSAPERSLYSGAAVQLAHKYGIPACGVGGATESKVSDVQAGYEKALSFITLAMDGHNMIQGGLGMIETHMAVSMEQSVIDDEIFQMVFRIMRGSEVSERTISEALDVIGSVGPERAHYMSHPHTLRYLHSELYVPELCDRRRRASWEKDRKGVLENAHVKVERILKDHRIDPLPIDAANRIDKIARGESK